MTKEEFKRRWESDKKDQRISRDDITDCAESWGIKQPKYETTSLVIYKVLKMAQTIDCEDFACSNKYEEQRCH